MSSDEPLDSELEGGVQENVEAELASPGAASGQRPSKTRRKRRSILREYVEVLLISVLLALFARTFLLQAFAIPSGSMEPNMLVGDHVLVNKLVYGETRNVFERAALPLRRVRRGDVVVFRFPDDPKRDLVKRCIGLPGDQVSLIDKVLHINDEPVAEPFVRHADEQVYQNSRFLPDALRQRDNFGPVEVPPGELFCLGDNRDDSNDSRFWGTVPVDHVRGRAFVIYWSSQPTAPGDERPFWSTTRWPRFFKVIR